MRGSTLPVPFFILIIASIPFGAMAMTPIDSTKLCWVPDAATGVLTCKLGRSGFSYRQINLTMQGLNAIVNVQYYADVNNSTQYPQGPTVGFPFYKNGVSQWALNGRQNDIPQIRVNGASVGPLTGTSYVFDGTFTIAYRNDAGSLRIKRAIFPSVTLPAVIQEWTFENIGAADLTIEIPGEQQTLLDQTDLDNIPSVIERTVSAVPSQILAPQGVVSSCVAYTFRHASAASVTVNAANEKAGRQQLFAVARQTMALTTPEPLLDAGFTLAKFRVLEMPMRSQRGMVPTTGSLQYYPGVWANDNVEYAAPAFSYLNHPALMQAADSMFEIWLKDTQAGRSLIGSYETYTMYRVQSGRGDNAMILYGLSYYLLASGDVARAQHFWPIIQQAVKELKAARNAQGAIQSNTDELEGRYPTGSANLSTTTLAYGGMRLAALLAQSLGKSAEFADYSSFGNALSATIESYFGATVEGYATYRYFEGCTVLRGWICLPLTMGIMQRKTATLNALFSSRLWIEDAAQQRIDLAIQSGGDGGWPREFYYALRAIFAAGDAERGVEKTLKAVQYHVLSSEGPYIYEDHSGLAAPNVLFERVIPEGLFGLAPVNLTTFACTPRMPAAWPRMKLAAVYLAGHKVDITIERSGQDLRCIAQEGQKTILDQTAPAGTAFILDFQQTRTLHQRPAAVHGQSVLRQTGRHLELRFPRAAQRRIELYANDGKLLTTAVVFAKSCSIPAVFSRSYVVKITTGNTTESHLIMPVH